MAMRSHLAITGPVLLAMTVQPSAADLPDAIVACRSIPSASERLDCYDRIVDQRESSASSAPPSDDSGTAKAAGIDVRSTTIGRDIPEDGSQAAPEVLFGKNATEIQRHYEELAGLTAIDQIDASVTQIWTIAPDIIAIKLDNEQIWRQTAPSRLRLAEGDQVTVRRASLGSFMLQKSGSSRMMRVSRAD